EGEVRKQIAQHSHTPVADLERLAGDPELTQYCLNNPRLTPAAFVRLAAHPNDTVRCCVAAHPRTPIPALSALAQDTFVPAREAVARHPATPTHLLAQLAEDEDMSVPAALAGNLNTPPEALARIYARLPNRTYGRELSIVSMLAQHPHSPTELLARMMKRANRDIRDMVSRNPNMPIALLDQLLAPPEPEAESPSRNVEDMKHQILRSLHLRHRYYDLSLTPLLALSYSFMAAALLAKQAETLSWIERYVIARHPNADRATMERLAHDSNRFVRAAARERLATP
ncbi:MAG TPA: hypothetical protein VKB76_17215, partial [Ktedonobacterales bacterium]|nr:hypothetical protein [Ktedonobacterales bacterium]